MRAPHCLQINGGKRSMRPHWLGATRYNMIFPVWIRTTEREGVYGATAFVLDKQVAEVEVEYQTESDAIKACRNLVKELSR